MAENTTTYTAVIDTQVKGADEVEGLGEKAEETAGAFVKLQLQIRQTQKDLQAAAAAGDKVKFKQLRAQLDDLEDGLEKVQLQSKQFEDQLGSLPGPAGAAGNAIKSIDGAFKILIANPIIAVIAGIAAVLMLMKKALSSTAEGQETLNKIQSAFAKILGPILALVEKVALPIFEGFAKVLEFVAAGFSKLVQALGISEAKIKEATFNIDEVQQDAAEKEKKRQEDLTKATEEANKKREEANKKAAEARKKREEEAKKKAEEDAKKLADANKVLTEAYLATLDARDQEIFKAGVAQNERLLALELAGIKDKTSVLEQGRLELLAINKKYDDEQAKKVEEDNKKKAEDDKKKLEDDKAKEDKKREDNLLGLDTQLAFDNLTFQQRKDLISAKEAELLTNKELTENERTAIQKAAAAERKNIDNAELQAKADITNATADLVGQFGSFLQSIAGKNKKIAIAGIIVEQIASIAKIISNTAVANAKSVAAFPITAGMPFVAINTISAGLGIAASIAGAVKAIGQINSNSQTAPSGGAQLPQVAPAPPMVAGTPAPVIGGTQAATPGSQIADTLSATTGKPVRAYVVSGDISSNQALDRRTSNAATFGG